MRFHVTVCMINVTSDKQTNVTSVSNTLHSLTTSTNNTTFVIQQSIQYYNRSKRTMSVLLVTNTNLYTKLHNILYNNNTTTTIPYYELFIGFTIFIYIFELYLDIRQYSNYLIKNKPTQLTYIDDKQFIAAQSYGKDSILFGIFSGFISLLKTLIYLQYNIYPALWLYSVSLVNRYINATHSTITYEIYVTLIFFFLDQLIDLPINIPLSFYKTFVIEQKHGFNKQTVSLFFTDIIKSLVLTVIIATPLLSLFIYIIHITGDYFYIALTIFILIVQLIAISIYPTLIQPCFNKVTELPQNELRSRIEQLAVKCKFPLKQLYQIDGSKRSSHSNAYMYGFGKSKRIVLFDTLIQQCKDNLNAVVAIIGHEIGHWSLNHNLKNLIIIQINTLITFRLFASVQYNTVLFESFGFYNNTSQSSIFIGLLLFQFIYSPISHLTGLLMHILSRHFEYEADKYGVIQGFGQGLKDGLIQLFKENKSSPIRDTLYSTYHDSHPTMLQRIDYINMLQKKYEN